MDQSVLRAIARWPDVPAIYGWLALDRRGNWQLKESEGGTFGRIGNAALRDFIGRNYAADERGCWFFQNGPQRVYVELEAAPWVWRLTGSPPAIVSHTGRSARFVSAALDEHGRLFVATDIGLGIVHSLDMESASDAVDAGVWPVEEVRFATLPARYGYVLSPAAAGR